MISRWLFAPTGGVSIPRILAAFEGMFVDRVEIKLERAVETGEKTKGLHEPD